MSLIDIVDNSVTDKNTTHSYLELYEKLLNSKKQSVRNVLEIGVHHGGSIKLWHDYFTNATVYGLDVININQIPSFLKNNIRIKIFASTDAYSSNTIDNLKSTKFDMVLDDGPHTLQSMITFVREYSQILSDDGILILEDVQDINWINGLKNATPQNLKQFIEVYDLRHIKGRYDDIVFVINKKPTI
jgi:hypothetical protein